MKTAEEIREMIEDLNKKIRNSKSLTCKEIYFRKALLWVLNELEE
jgi:hypothetical protein